MVMAGQHAVLDVADCSESDNDDTVFSAVCDNMTPRDCIAEVVRLVDKSDAYLQKARAARLPNRRGRGHTCAL